MQRLLKLFGLCRIKDTESYIKHLEVENHRLTKLWVTQSQLIKSQEETIKTSTGVLEDMNRLCNTPSKKETIEKTDNVIEWKGK